MDVSINHRQPKPVHLSSTPIHRSSISIHQLHLKVLRYSRHLKHQPL
jgi:hypothetical protein